MLCITFMQPWCIELLMYKHSVKIASMYSFLLSSYTKSKIDFLENWSCVRISVFLHFLFVFSATFENYHGHFEFLPPK